MSDSFVTITLLLILFLSQPPMLTIFVEAKSNSTQVTTQSIILKHDNSNSATATVLGHTGGTPSTYRQNVLASGTYLSVRISLRGGRSLTNLSLSGERNKKRKATAGYDKLFKVLKK